MRRLMTFIEVGALAAASAIVVMTMAAGPAHAAVQRPAYPSIAPEPAPPATIRDQVHQALTRLPAETGKPHAGTPETLTHPGLDSMGSTMSSRSVFTSPSRGNAPPRRQASSAVAQPGLDVSSFQGAVDWNAVAADGATFAYVKATEGTYDNSTDFAAQYNGSYGAGLIRGAYHFAIPNNSTGAAQADFFVAYGGGWSADRRTLPGMVDLEYNPYGTECYGLTPSEMVGWINSFDGEYHHLTGRWPDVYTSTDWWTTCIGNSAVAGQESLSIANWSGSPLPLPHGWATQTFWQWADSGTFPGDQETFHGSRQALIDFAAGATRTGTAPGAAGAFKALNPVRVLDTRAGNGAPPAAVPAWHQLSVQITGTHGIPVSGVSAVVVNLTVTAPTRTGYLTAYPDRTSRPVVSNLNFTPGKTVANLAVVPVGADGRITVYNGSSGTVQVVADLAGYYLAGHPVAAGTYRSSGPVRVLDTRTGNGAQPAAVLPWHQLSMQITGTHGIPVSGVSAVVLNLTVTAPTRTGYLTAYPDRTSRPVVSNLNFTLGKTVANLAVVPVGADGRITVYNGSSGTVQVVADLAGYYLAGHPEAAGTMQATPLARILDTRIGLGAAAHPVAARSSLLIQVSGTAGIPSTGVAAIIASVTAVTPVTAGYLTVRPPTSRATTSNLNFTAHLTVANLVIVPLDPDGRVQLINGSGGTADVLVDIAGYYLKTGTH